MARSWEDRQGRVERSPKNRPERDGGGPKTDRPDQTNWETGGTPGDTTQGAKDPKKQTNNKPVFVEC